MTYFFILMMLMLLIAALSKPNACSPFQSEQAKEICSHMTKGERRGAMQRGALWGLLIGIIPGAIGAVSMLIVSSALVGVVLGALILPLVGLVVWKKWFPSFIRSQQTFLASTSWAKAQGMKANDIQLFNFPKRR